jgi:hypothetical protein
VWKRFWLETVLGCSMSDDDVSRQAKALTLFLEQDLPQYMCAAPLLASTDDIDVEPQYRVGIWGTCTLIRAGALLFGVTANHVINKIDDDGIVVPARIGGGTDADASETRRQGGHR